MSDEDDVTSSIQDQANDHALVLFSGGQDSATCLAWALARYRHVETIGFAYGQRHAVELACRAPLREGMAALAGPDTTGRGRTGSGTAAWGTRLGADHLVDLGTSMAAIGATALTSDAAIEIGADGLPTTFVPGRNLLFLTYAAAVAWRRGLRRIVGGMCETDYSGYPDCRDDTIKAMQVALNLGLQRRFVLETPLMWRDKAATWALAEALGGAALVALIEEHSHSCYRGERSRRHPWGYGCGDCPACALRRAGWERWRAGSRNAGDAAGNREADGQPAC